MGFSEESCDPEDFCFTSFLNFEENFKDVNLRMTIQNRFELREHNENMRLMHSRINS